MQASSGVKTSSNRLTSNATPPPNSPDPFDSINGKLIDLGTKIGELQKKIGELKTAADNANRNSFWSLLGPGIFAIVVAVMQLGLRSRVLRKTLKAHLPQLRKTSRPRWLPLKIISI